MALKMTICNCQSDHRINHFKKARSFYKISKIGRLSVLANESSGLARGQGDTLFWTHNDSGGKPELIGVNAKGESVSHLEVRDAQNVDWEDLAQDENGNLYAGDFGNNGNARKNLAIYKIPESGGQTEKITFRYSDQKEFPPMPEDRNFDCEAFFYHRGFFYLFSKNRSHSNHYVKLYKVPAQPGDHTTAPLDSIQIKAQVTAADISPDGKTFALLTYGKILLFGIKNDIVTFNVPQRCIRFSKKQSEGLIFLNNTDMMASNEQRELFRIIQR
jgi:hypothetical protein